MNDQPVFVQVITVFPSPLTKQTMTMQKVMPWLLCWLIRFKFYTQPFIIILLLSQYLCPFNLTDHLKIAQDLLIVNAIGNALINLHRCVYSTPDNKG